MNRSQYSVQISIHKTIMTLLYIPYASVNKLIKRFHHIDQLDQNSELFWTDLEKYNFVLVDPQLYFGSYGGLIRNNLLLKDMYRHYSYISFSILNTFSFVWWFVSEPPAVGTLLVSKQDNRVLIPKEIYIKLMKKSSIVRQVGKSSYYR